MMLTYSAPSSWNYSSNAGIHNSHFIPNDITPWYQDGSLWDRINGINGYDEFEGIFPGCYFNINNTIRNQAEPTAYADKRIIILGCNLLTKQGGSDNKIRYNHIVCCPYGPFGKGQMNETNTTVGGYYNSYMNTTIIGPVTNVGDSGGTINQQLYNEFGEHLKTIKERVSDRISETLESDIITDGSKTLGISDRSNYYSFQAILLSEIELYGHQAVGTYYDIGTAYLQYPVFRYNRALVDSETWCYLRDVANSVRFAGGTDFAGHTNSSDIRGIRPRFVLA